MRLGFLLIFIAVPLAELALLIKLGEIIGLWPTLALIVITALIGTAVLRQQGIKTLAKVSQSLNAGQAPVVPMVEGVLLLISGAFLLTPGLLTDIAGGLILVPPIRAFIAERGLKLAVQRGSVHVHTAGMGTATADQARQSRRRDQTGPDQTRPDQTGKAANDKFRQQSKRSDRGPVIDGDFERLDEKTIDPRSGQ